MIAKWTRWLVVLAACGLAGGAGCAEERAPINRVQANALKKSFFVGERLDHPGDDPEFWTRGTLIDVGFGAAQTGLFTSTYAQPVSRLKWVITEDLLIGRITYERVADTDGKGDGPASTDGTIAVAFEITKHFDVTRSYNEATGEQRNIVEENDADRPWYEREYMRVDWSKNLATDSYDFDTLSMLGVLGGVEYEDMTYYVNDPDAPDAPYFDPESGYFDVTTKAFAKPKEVDLSRFGWGFDKLPACWLDNDFMQGSAPSGNCNPVELTIRHSFRRVENTDYEPVDWDGYRFQAYGGFYVARTGYARNYGMSDDKHYRFLSRYDIWERSHYYDDPENMRGDVACYTQTPFGGDPHYDDGDGTEDECAAVTDRTGFGGSRCDTFKQRCTLPYRARTPKPVVWYYAAGSHPDYFAASAEAAHEWDVALRSAVVTAQYAECVNTGGAQDDCAQSYPTYFGQQDDNAAAVALAAEVDACRAGTAHADRNRDEAACQEVAEEIGAARGATSGVIALAKLPEMLVLCHSPVEAGDHPACGEQRLPEGISGADCTRATELLAAATDDESAAQREEDLSLGEARAIAQSCKAALNVRRGDLRYHQVNVIAEPQTPSPWGIYVDAEDPLTGEKVAASINVWSHVTDQFSQKVVDTVRYIKRELLTSDITEGQHVKDWALASEAAARGGLAPKLTKAQLDQRAASFAGAELEDVDLSPNAIDAALKEQLVSLKHDLSGVAASVGAASTTAPVYQARREQAQGTEFEAELVTKMMQQYAGVDTLPLGDATTHFASPLRGANPALSRQLRQLREVALAERGVCMMHEAPAPLALTGLADILEDKFSPVFGIFNPGDDLGTQQTRAEAIRKYVAHRAHYSVMLHEMGHSIGLRHNFVSSSDAWSYRPQYWQLRTKNGAVSQQCEDLVADGERCVGPRYFDPVTQEEQENLIWMFMHSSVMDYAGEVTQDFMGLGAYDFAAARMFYGENVAVHADPSYRAGSNGRATGLLAKMDNFGGILGIQPQIGEDDIHYSALQANYELIRDCQPVNPDDFKPSTWDEARYGRWDPVLDGGLVSVDGEFTQCRQQPVDYVPWQSLRTPTSSDGLSGFYRGGPSVDQERRIRVPYGFATDSWADLGNASVYRHDNGADTYEIFDFLITQQEVYHIFDNYRRNRQDFSVRSAVNRSLSRYNEKMRDGAKGLGLIANILRDTAYAAGLDFQSYFPWAARNLFNQSVVAAGLTFDHFARIAARPQSGPHYYQGNVLRSNEDAPINNTPSLVIPNGASGYFGNLSFGGRPLENALSDRHGEFDREYTLNAGSYYDKAFTAMLFTESVDNFISSSRTDFLDARYRAVSLADLFPEGYRRWLANMLTGDDFIKGARVAADADGRVLVDGQMFSRMPLGWTTWWTEEPEVCIPAEGTTVCTTYAGGSDPLDPRVPEGFVAVDPQVGWEQQKFLIAWTLLYLPENQKQTWLDQLRIWELGADSDPGFTQRIELHHPSGKVYVAKTLGKETIFGKTVQRAIGARVLEYADELLTQAYETTPGPDLDGDGTADWNVPVIDAVTGQPIVKYDPSISAFNGTTTEENPECNADTNAGCTCSSNRACGKLQDYLSVPAFLRQALAAYGMAAPSQKGIY